MYLNVRMEPSVVGKTMAGRVVTITEGGENVLKTGQQCVPNPNVLLMGLITVVTLIVAHTGEEGSVVKILYSCSTFSFLDKIFFIVV